MSSGKFDAVHASKYQNPVNFRQQLWNDTGPTVDSMMVQFSMINDNLPPGAQKVRPAEEAAMLVKVTGRDKEGVRSLGIVPGG